MARAKKTILLLGIWVGAAMSCGQVAPTTQTGLKRIAADEAPKEPPDKAPMPESAPLVVAGDPVEVPEPTPRPKGFRLPVDEGFANAPIPEADPGQYKSWREKNVLRVGQSHLYHATLLDNDRLLLVASAIEGELRIYNTKSRKLQLAFPVPGIKRMDNFVVAPWPGDEPLFLLGKSDGLWMMSAASGDTVSLLDGTRVTAMRWSPDRRILVAAASDISTQTSVLTFYYRQGPRHLEKLGVVRFPERVDGWDLSRDNRLLAVTYYPSDTLELIDLHKEEALYRIPTPEYGGDVSFSPDGRAIAVVGSGLMLVDAENPSKRTLYTRFGNNIGEVRFSPNGDAVITSSYDGKVRIFTYVLSEPKLTLTKTLSHAGTSNTYRLLFPREGGLITSSGDKTLRFWGGPKTSRAPLPRIDSAATPIQIPGVIQITFPKPDPPTIEERRALLESIKQTKRHRPKILDGPPRKSRIKPGKYACRVAKEYKLRDCVVEKNEDGHVMLEVGEGNLIAMRGVLYDDGNVVRFEGWPTDERPFGCYSCQERCFIRPETCGCTPAAANKVIRCLQQPLHAVFRGEGGSFKGLLLYRSDYDENVPTPPPPANVKFADANDRFTMVLKKR